MLVTLQLAVKLSMTTLWITQYLAACGVGSRRDCEGYVHNGIVQLRGSTIRDCSTQIHIPYDEGQVSVNNKVVSMPSLRMFLYHKKPQIIVSRKDSRRTIFDDLRDIDNCLVSVGRLDYMSEGLIIITNNGMLARAWETADVVRQYTVLTKLTRRENWPRLRREFHRLCIDGVRCKPVEIGDVTPAREGLHEIQVRLREGKNREIRSIWEHYGWRIHRLIRTHYGPFRLDRMRGKKYIEIKPSVPSDHDR